MTKKGFKYAMQRGLGRGILELKHTEHIEKYRDLVLWGCSHELAYDAQCEGSRSFYLYEMIQLFPDVMPFLERAEKRMNQCIRDRGWEFSQHCQLLALFAGDGNEFAIQSLQQCYEHLLNILRNKRKRTNQGLLPERDNFEELCISIATYSPDIAICLKRYLDIAADMGALFSSNSLFASWNFDWFQAACESSLGERRVLDALMRMACNSAEVQAYKEAMEKEAAERNERWNNRDSETPVTAEAVYTLMTEGKKAGSGIPLSLMRRMQNNGCSEEVQKLGTYYSADASEEVRLQLLKLLCNCECSYVLDVGQLISDSKTPNEELQEYAFRALGTLKNDRVYEYALELVSDPERRMDVISMLAKNYHKKDREMLVSLTESIPISYDNGEWHGAFSSVIDIFEDSTIKNPPRELLVYMYENTLCSFCRCVIVKEMGRRRMLTDELLQECLYDSNSEIREYAQRRLEVRKTMLEKFISREDKRIGRAATEQILTKFKSKFVISDYDPKNQRRSCLLHCNLACETRQIATEDFESIPFDRKKKVYFYSERHRKMYKVAFAEVCRLIAGLEPWEEIDAEVFDDSYEWFLAITHEDVTMIYGLNF